MPLNVAIVGAGQLGSRHLQGLANCETPLTIFLVDPSAISIRTAEERFEAVPNSENHTLHTVGAVSDLPCNLELVIVACTASSRFMVYKELLKYTYARVILLEKVLFQDLDQYPCAIELLAASKSQIIVNLSQRYWPFFRDLRSKVVDKSQLSITITGSNWGLGCNAVHNVDIAEFIWEKQGQTLARLDGELRESKRADCHEFTGTIETLFDGGGRLTQTSYAEGEAPFVITAQTPDFIWIWDVSHGKSYRSDQASEWSFVTESLIVPYQSNLTTRLVEDVLANRTTDLPDLASASITHLATLSEILNSCLANGHDFGRVCPVT